MPDDYQDIETYKILGISILEPNSGEAKKAWAMVVLESGSSAESILNLAILESPVNEFEAETLFSQALEELNVSIPAAESALIGYVKAISFEVSNGSRDPDDGFSLIYEIDIYLDYPEVLDTIFDLENNERIRSWDKIPRHIEIKKVCKELVHTLRFPKVHP